MRFIRRTYRQFAGLFRRTHCDADFSAELRAHLQAHFDDNLHAGMVPDEAHRDALLKLGSLSVAAEEVRDRRGLPFVDRIAQDVRYALRALRHNPGFAAAATLTLALGIGAVTVIFSVVNGVLLTPLPYPHPDRLVRLQERTAEATQFGSLWAFAYPNFLDVRRDSRSLDMAAWRFSGGIVSAPGAADYVDGREVSAGLFGILGVRFSRGRDFLPEDDRLGAAPVAIISHALWQSRYSGSAGVIGERIVVDGRPYTVVGVTPPEFTSLRADVFTLLGQDTAPYMQRRQAHAGIQAWARLRPGIALAGAQAELTQIGRRLAGQYPDSNAGRDFVAERLQPNIGDVGSTLWLLLGAVGLILLIACANIASLLLARAVSREHELAMRAALGASRGRLAAQCLTESMVLGLIGGTLGVAIAAGGIRPFVAIWPGALPRADLVHLDWRVLLVALAASLVSGLLFGLAPALRTPAAVLARGLHLGARGATGSRRLHGAFVVSQIALATVLLVAAGMFGRTLLRLTSLDPGMDVHNILITRVGLSPATLASPAAVRGAWLDILRRAHRVPGVTSIAMIDTVPMREGNNQLGFWTSPGLPPRNQQPVALASSVTPEYLDVTRIPLRRGRFFNEHDRLGAEPVVVIDEVMAQKAFGNDDAVGRRLWIPDMATGPVTVVGVVAHVRHWGLAGDDDALVRAQFYYPFAQVPDQLLRRWSELMSIAVRSSVEPLTLVESLRREVRGIANDQVLYEVRTMEQLAGDSIARQRFLLRLFSVFAGVALLLACIGLYGVLAYLVDRRTRELGVRVALGARAGDVTWLVFRQSLAMIAIGVVLGLSGAAAAVRLLQTLVAGMRPPDVQTFAGMTAILVLSAAAASLVPAWRATRVDPIIALRTE